MWAFLYRLASPKQCYRYLTQALPWLNLSCCLLFVVGFVWVLAFTPADYQQGEAVRIMYLHVPSAFMSLAIYAYMAFLALLFLIWQIKLAGLLMNLCAKLGAVMTVLALITGSLWGKPMWGTWWVWDARLTSELILLFLYLGIIALHQSIQQPSKADKSIAILVLIGLVDLPVIHYSVYWWNTLHQGSTLNVFAKPNIHSSMLYPLLWMILAFGSYAALALASAARSEILSREYRSAWVKQLLMEERC